MSNSTAVPAAHQPFTVDEVDTRSAVLDEVRSVVIETLGLPDGDDLADESSGLFGRLPELDSLTVVELILALQQRFGIRVDDEDVTVEAFVTLGSLVTFVERKRQRD